MDWFRWHHGSVHDPRLRTVARRSQQPEGIVLAVLALMRENASQADPRGSVERWDDEDAGIALGWPTEGVSAIREAMEGKYLKDGALVDWEREQPKREREDPSADRVRAFRERKQQETTQQPKKRSVTPGNATKRLDKSREEEIRSEEEKILGAVAPESGGRAHKLLVWWIDKQAAKPSQRDIGKAAGIAKRICDDHTDEEIGAAMRGMVLLYPYSEGAPWGLVELEAKFLMACEANLTKKTNGNGRSGGTPAGVGSQGGYGAGREISIGKYHNQPPPDWATDDADEPGDPHLGL